MTPDSDSKPILLIVLNAFQIEGRGTVLTGFLDPQSKLAKPGALIELQRPDGVCIPNLIAGIESFRGRPPDAPPNFVGLLLATSVPSEELPEGTEVRYLGPSQVA